MTIEYFEDIEPGMTLKSAPYPISAEEIRAFASKFDPMPFHLDENAGKSSMLGGLSASGWHLCSIMMRMICDTFLTGANGQGSPGVDKCEWLAPVLAGDAVTGKITFTQVRASKSRPGLGVVHMRCELFRNDGTLALRFSNPFLMKGREAA